MCAMRPDPERVKRLISDEMVDGMLDAVLQDLLIAESQGITEVESRLLGLAMSDEGPGDIEIPIELPDGEHHEYMEFVGEALVQSHIMPLLVIFVSEAWMVKVDPEEFERREPRMEISKDPRRVECVVMTAMAADGRTATVTLEIKRHENDDNIHLEPPATDFLKDRPKDIPAEAANNSLLVSFYHGVHKGAFEMLTDKVNTKRKPKADVRTSKRKLDDSPDGGMFPPFWPNNPNRKM